MVKQKETKSRIWYRLGIGAIIFVVFALAFGGVVWRAGVKTAAYREAQAEVLAQLQMKLGELYEDAATEVPRKAVTEDEIEAIETGLPEVKLSQYDSDKVEIERKLRNLRDLVAVREEMAEYIDQGVVDSEITTDVLEGIGTKLAELPENYRNVLQSDYDEMRKQCQEMVDVRQAVVGLFTDEEMKTVAPRLTRNAYREVVARVDNLPQREIAEQYTEALAKVDTVLKQREKEAAEARQRAIEAKRRAEELRRKQQQAEAAAWRVLNVPYHSQNLQQIYNGCEAASMLMGLQYKGYLSGVDLHRYAEMMPKSEDYNTGFVGSIYDLQPKTYVHWIAPAPLAKFGRESSGNQNVVDLTGASLADLDREVVAGNPVVIYVTFLFNPLKDWLNGAPQNLHVVLLTGYNEKTGAQRLTDPWTQSGGGRTYDLSREELERIYNAVGKKAVVIR